ncbi:MAG: hypothetical protein IPO08_18865 [Xanthomonadales bacterium]|nr:hypothetical protein [Xanthomonadales bacterium]
MERSTLLLPMRTWKRSVAGSTGAERIQLLAQTPTGVHPVIEGRGLSNVIRVSCTDEQLSTLRAAMGRPHAGARIRAVALLRSLELSQSDIGALLDLPRSEVARIGRYASLPPPVLAYLDAGRLTLSHARELLKAPDPLDLAHRAVAKGLSFRRLRAEISTAKPNADLAYAESELFRYLQSTVKLSRDASKEIVIDIPYTGLLVLLGVLESLGKLNPEARLLATEPARLCRIVLSEQDLDTLVRSLPPV